MLLSSWLFVPIICCLLVYFFITTIVFDRKTIKLNSNIVSGIILFITALHSLTFDYKECDLDEISLMFLILTALVFPSIYIYVNEFVIFSYETYIQCIIAIQFLTTIAFSIDNLLAFYFTFEAIMFPMFILVGAWGSRGRRAHAVYQFFFFTALGSIFILLGIAYIVACTGTLSFHDFKILNYQLSIYEQVTIGILFFIGFMSKIPSLPLHIWLPETHVEAPTVGSVILAALLLKFGFYGMYRVIISVCSVEAFEILSPLFLTICTISLVFSSFAAIRQVDLKKIIAYSSVAHMNFALIGICLMPIQGSIATNYLMFSHGLISSAMFFAVGLIYERFHTRNLIYFGGLAQIMPIFASMLLIIMFSNIGLPGTSNFVGEIVIFFAAYQTNFVILSFLVFSTLLVSIFSMIVLVRIIFYQFSGFFEIVAKDLNLNEFMLLGVFVIYIVLFGIFPNFIFNIIDTIFV
jgi:NADH-quinone oxidoreductase subunit M